MSRLLIDSPAEGLRAYGCDEEEIERVLSLPWPTFERPRPARAPKAHIPTELRWAVWERDNFTCQRCGARRHLSVDHRVPESKGGPTTFENLQTLCSPCNTRKAAT